MKSLYFECQTGISGDMIVASLLDAGADPQVLQKALDSIPADGFTTKISRVQKSGVDMCDFDVILDSAHQNHDHEMEYLYGHTEHADSRHEEHEHHQDEHEHHHHDHEHDGHHHHEHRGLSDIIKIINTTVMSDKARAIAIKTFDIVAEAESKAHNKSKDEVHFHEVGAIDSIVDIIAAAVCFDNLDISKVYVPCLVEGCGTVHCQHGILPIPVPAVANIASEHKLPLKLSNLYGERITPTGAAFIAAVMTDKKLPQDYTITRVGMGCGKRAYQVPSILRAFVIQEDSDIKKDTIWKVETNIDDSSGEKLSFAMTELFKAGARDVSFTPCFMKKNRPATLITVICEKKDIPQMERILFEQTTTIGIRRMEMERTVLPREIITVQTEYGTARVKKVTLQNGQKRYYPEYEDVQTIASEKGIAFDSVFEAIRTSAEKTQQ